jgi:hypothetical protein
MQKDFEKKKRILAAGLALSLGSFSLSTLETPAGGSNNPVTTTTIGENTINGLTVGAKLNTVKIISPVVGKNIENISLSSDPDSDNNGEDLVVFYSPALSQELLRAGDSKDLGISIGFLFTDEGRRFGVAESLVLFDTKSQIVRAFGSAKDIKNTWQPVYNPASTAGQPPLDFHVIDRAVNLHNHRGVEILIENLPGQTQAA